jgi:tetratricopeptide (TPR) repeat protein
MMPQVTDSQRTLTVALVLLTASLCLPVPARAQSGQSEERERLAAMVEARDLRQAQHQLRLYLERYPDDLAAWQLLGEAQMGRWLFEQATDSFERALDGGRENADLLRGWIESKGRSASRVSLIFKAKSLKDAALRVLEYDPYDVETRAALAAYYYIVPGFLGGDKDRADRLVSDLVELSPADGYYLMGRRAEEEEEGDPQILRHWHRALEEDPGHTLTLVDLGRFWSEQDSTSLSLSYYERAAASAPDDAQIQTSYARAYRHFHMYPESAEHFEIALRIDPYYAPARLNLAEYHERFGTVRDAIREYSTLALNNPTYREKDVRRRLRDLMGRRPR